MELKQKDIGIRFRTGLLLLVVTFGCIILNVWTYLAFFAVMIALSVHEFNSLMKPYTEDNKVSKWYTPLGIVISVLIFVLSFGVMRFSWNYQLLHFAIASPFLFFVLELFAQSEKPFINIGSNILGIFYFTVPFVALNFLVVSPLGYSWQLVISLISLIWANDIFAYLVGSQVGKTKLFPRISPGKTWEGNIGGALGAMAIGVALHFIFHLPNIYWFDWLVIALIVSVTATLGDLSESMLKRSLGVKDSGTLFPGHGGMLDRFDALYFTIPFVAGYLLLRWAF